jgi:hypothetical protein
MVFAFEHAAAISGKVLPRRSRFSCALEGENSLLFLLLLLLLHGVVVVEPVALRLSCLRLVAKPCERREDSAPAVRTDFGGRSAAPPHTLRSAPQQSSNSSKKKEKKKEKYVGDLLVFKGTS